MTLFGTRFNAWAALLARRSTIIRAESVTEVRTLRLGQLHHPIGNAIGFLLVTVVAPGDRRFRGFRMAAQDLRYPDALSHRFGRPATRPLRWGLRTLMDRLRHHAAFSV